MFHPNGKGLLAFTGVMAGAIASLLSPSAMASEEIMGSRGENGAGTRVAHQVEIAGDVGGTLHIEPNDTPRAGEEALTWFALTKRGGQTIPLSSCDCSLAVYAQPYREGDEAIATPSLRAVSAEGYNGIPAADILFPTPGAYELVLTGQPLTT
ncbi:MAG: hypothetical protein F6K30_06465, partial [Cyanothece sp. SIO2G6]|nr:hypothetical protein [Cyanothece sp. SIO2G6]